MFAFDPLRLPGLLAIRPDVHADARGFFAETYREEEYRAKGLPLFVQDSHSHSIRNVVRGLKFQYDAPTDKLVRVTYGSVFAVVVDIRPDSPTFRSWEGIELSAENHKQLYVPFGYAFGFCVTSETADVMYKLSAVHNGNGGGTIRWNDPEIGIAWPVANPLVAEADNAAPTLAQWLSSPESTSFVNAYKIAGV